MFFLKSQHKQRRFPAFFGQKYNVYIDNSHEQTRKAIFQQGVNLQKFEKMSLPKAQIDQLKAFVSVLKAKPDILHHPDLSFLKE